MRVSMGVLLTLMWVCGIQSLPMATTVQLSQQDWPSTLPFRALCSRDVLLAAQQQGVCSVMAVLREKVAPCTLQLPGLIEGTLLQQQAQHRATQDRHGALCTQ